MKIITKYTNLESTPAIDVYIEEKIGSLEKFLKPWEVNTEAVARVEIARTTNHHKRGDVFRAEINLDLPNNLLRATEEDWDVRTAINKTKDKLRQEIKKLAGKLDSQKSQFKL